MNKPILVALCNLTTNFVLPWLEAGWVVVMVDPQHEDFGEGNVLKFPGTVVEALPFLSLLIASGNIRFVAGFPPCTDVAVSGARWWKDKHSANPYFQAKASIVAEQCRMLGGLSGAPWFFENPVSAFSEIFGPPNYTFHPYYYAGYCLEDNYTKQTCLWTGNGFRMPAPYRVLNMPPPDDRIFKAAPGEERANYRSATPKGFARAVFEANSSH